MDQKIVSKEILTYAIRDAIRHINRNLYEWNTGYYGKKKRVVLTYTEAVGLARNWLIRSLRDKIGIYETDRLFKGIYVCLNEDSTRIKSVTLSYAAKNEKLYTIINDILTGLSYQLLGYNPKDYEMDGMSNQKNTSFDPTFCFSLEEIRTIKF